VLVNPTRGGVGDVQKWSLPRAKPRLKVTDPLRLAGSKPWTLHPHHALKSSEIHFYHSKSTFRELGMLVYSWSKFTALADPRHDSLSPAPACTPSKSQQPKPFKIHVPLVILMDISGLLNPVSVERSQALTQTSIFESLNLENTQRSANDGGVDSYLDNWSIISSSSEDGHVSDENGSEEEDEPIATQNSVAIALENHGKKEYDDGFKLRALQLARDMKSVAKARRALNIPRTTMANWMRKWKATKSIENKPRSGRPRKLDEDDTLHLKDYLEEFPSASNEQLAAHLQNKLAPRSVSHYTKRMGYTRKKITDETTNWPDEEDLQTIKSYFQTLEIIPEGNRVYFDESYICGNEAQCFLHQCQLRPCSYFYICYICKPLLFYWPQRHSLPWNSLVTQSLGLGAIK
jgi:transposase